MPCDCNGPECFTCYCQGLPEGWQQAEIDAENAWLKAAEYDAESLAEMERGF